MTTDNIISVIEETSELVTEELNTADVTYVAEILNNVVDRPIADSEIDKVTGLRVIHFTRSETHC